MKGSHCTELFVVGGNKLLMVTFLRLPKRESRATGSAGDKFRKEALKSQRETHLCIILSGYMSIVIASPREKEFQSLFV